MCVPDYATSVQSSSNFVIRRWTGYFFMWLGFTLWEVALLPFLWWNITTCAFFYLSFQIAALSLCRKGDPVHMFVLSFIVRHILFMSHSLLKIIVCIWIAWEIHLCHFFPLSSLKCFMSMHSLGQLESKMV